jgi:hypothetical protein
LAEVRFFRAGLSRRAAVLAVRFTCRTAFFAARFTRRTAFFAAFLTGLPAAALAALFAFGAFLFFRPPRADRVFAM